MKYKLSKGQKLAIVWLVSSTIILYLNSMLVIKYRLYGVQDHCKFAFFLPAIHLGSMTAFAFISTFYFHLCPNSNLRKDNEYIKQNYPEIWNRLHSNILCKVSSLYVNTLASSMFIRNKYDDGTDDKLNRIKWSIKLSYNIIGGAVLLTLTNIIFSFILYAAYPLPPT